MNVNLVVFAGRLGRDPEVRMTSNGNAMATFSMAYSEKYKGEESTTWMNIVAFGKTAELCGQYLNKGDSALVEGRLQVRSWEKDGETRYSTEIVARNVQFGQKKGEGGGQPRAQARTQRPARARPTPEPTPDLMDDDIPF